LPVDEHVTRTIRIDSKLDKALRDEADERGQSVNNIVESLIHRYINNDRFFTEDQIVGLAPTTLSHLFEGLSNEATLKAGSNTGRLRARNNLLIRGLPLEYDSLKWFITDVLGGYRGWFRCSFHEMDEAQMFHLRHSLGESWSLFIKSYLESMFRDILEIELEAEAVNSTVALMIPNKEI
jgi:hypothetical protein